MQNYSIFPQNMNLPRWKRNMFFTGVRNATLFKWTVGGFPVTEEHSKKATHPIFVLAITSYGPEVCPCSRKNWYDKDDRRYIRGGACTSTKHIIRDTTYLVEEHRFSIPRSVCYAEGFKEDFTNIEHRDYLPLYCMGVVKDDDIKG